MGYNKYGAKITEYNGVKYHSKREAAYAEQLDWKVKLGEIQSWTRQFRIPLVVFKKLICTYIIDFVVLANDGHKQYVEIKGFETADFKLKWKLVQALNEDKTIEFLIVK